MTLTWFLTQICRLINCSWLSLLIENVAVVVVDLVLVVFVVVAITRTLL